MPAGSQKQLISSDDQPALNRLITFFACFSSSFGEINLLARCFLTELMALDQNEKKLVEKLVEVLELLDASEEDIQSIIGSEKIDEDFLKKAAKFFDNTEACNVCSHAFHSWRNTVNDETVLSFLDDWINWKKKNKGSATQARIVQMRKRS